MLVLATRLFFTFAFSLLCTQFVSAQEFNFRRAITPFPINSLGHKGKIIELEFPFLGGFNAPRPQFVDINGDGALDLFIQEEGSDSNQPGQLIYFENTGTPQNFQFEWKTDWYKNIDIGNTYRFIDFDFDGDFDLFAESAFSRIRYFRNDGDANSADFVVVTDTLRDTNGSEIFIDVSSQFELADINCNSTLDLFLGRAAQGTITQYKNLGFDADGLPQFEFITNRFQDISIIGEGTGVRKSGAKHGSNGLTFTDIDNDDDLDLFWGDLFEPSIVFFENIGDCTTPNLSMVSRLYPPTNPITTSGFNLPRFADIDNDGDQDLFVGVLGLVFSTTRNSSENFFYFQNVNSAEQPIFSLIKSQFISTVDIGTNSVPVFIDIDNDLDQDLFLVNEEDPSGSGRSQFYFFENKGTPQSPVFQLVDDDFLTLDVGFNVNFAPAFVDIDNDDDPDLFIGRWDGQLSFFENIGSGEFSNLIQNYTAIIDSVENFIDVGNNNTPCFVDIDDDDDFDLFMGEFGGTINFFRNEGSADEPKFVQVTNRYFDIGIESNHSYSFPTFSDLDNDGDPDLIVGFEKSEILLYRNLGLPDSANFVEDNTFAIVVRKRSTPVFVDIDGDDDLDFFTGTNRGGLLFYENQEFASSVESIPSPIIPEKITLHQNYPNPFNPGTKIEYELQISPNQIGQFHTLTIFNLLGQKIREWRIQNSQVNFRNAVIWDGNDNKNQQVSSGIYFYRLTLNSENFLMRKMTLIR